MDIIEAVKFNDTRIVSDLLKQRHDPNTLRRALYFAINNRNLPIVKLLLNKNLMSITREANQETELPYPDYYHLADAVFNGSTEIVKLLLERGALAYLFTEKSSYSDQPTILMLASQEGHWEIVKALVEAGADVNITRQGEMSALQAAASNGYQAIKVNCRKIVRALLQYGADVNAKDYDGNTALSIAKGEGHDELVQLLLDAGATEN